MTTDHSQRIELRPRKVGVLAAARRQFVEWERQNPSLRGIYLTSPSDAYGLDRKEPIILLGPFYDAFKKSIAEALHQAGYTFRQEYPL